MMAKRTEEPGPVPATPAAGPALPRMLTLDQVKEVLNVNTPVVYALVRSGELRAAQFGGRGYLVPNLRRGQSWATAQGHRG
jgi:excisionase family DNA binding protein